MYKTKQIWNPLSTVFRRVLPTTYRLDPVSANSQIQYFFSHLQYSSRVFPRNGLDFFPDSKISLPSFCSQSDAKLDSSTKRCWNCVADAPGSTPFLYCHSCRSIQPLDLSIDYFQIFGLEKKYEIEVDGLEGRYKDWQKKLHPDLVHSKSEKEREYAAEQSARVIDAYRTLSKPLSRAIYILRLEGVDVDEEQTVSDPELLTEMKEKFEETSNSFANAFRRRNFDEAVACIQKMTYYQRANEEILKKL